jgi:predicted nucleic-acid-binding Zn-ribbon protein
MNEFTKEELQTLYHMTCSDCDYIIRDVSKLSQSEGTELLREFYVGMLKQLHDMRMKIQSMINNYCEHDVDEFRRGEDVVLKCAKCGKSEWF